MLTRIRSDPSRTRLPLGGWVALLALILLAVAVLGVCVGSVPLPVGDVVQVVLAKVGIGTPTSPLNAVIVWDYRIPRVIAAMTAGAGLTVSGIALQGLVRNPLADPYVVGVSSGASFGAVLVMVAGGGALLGLGVPAGAFAGAVLVLTLVFLFAQRRGAFTDNRLVLAGVALGYIAAAGTSFVQLQAKPGQLTGILFWTLGSVSGARWNSLPIPVTVILVCVLWLLTQGRALNALSLGDDAATAVGVHLRRLRLSLLLVAALCAAVTVGIAGGVGFVGLIIPHAARLLVGADHRRVLPVGALLGAVFLVAVDLVARTAGSPHEFPLTIFTALAGGPFFLFLMQRERGQ
ncbi:FecCD family ABC transporter permease [Amycolatopsis jejuensis]|uniref:FecCD family ABC transporter permease n=1 Tax=Amycolatopsis jejuensis TaxID=330084 RepID=UPI000A72D98E|nr:iron ABC transporter permease [Amycolatopsis jejuensis]